MLLGRHLLQLWWQRQVMNRALGDEDLPLNSGVLNVFDVLVLDFSVALH